VDKDVSQLTTPRLRSMTLKTAQPLVLADQPLPCAGRPEIFPADNTEN
jgi:hypothetical protein